MRFFLKVGYKIKIGIKKVDVKLMKVSLHQPFLYPKQQARGC